MKQLNLLLVILVFLIKPQFSIAQNTSSDLQPQIFPYRAWAIAVLGNNRELEENYVSDAEKNAAEYGINTIEMHDYVMPGGIVDALSTFKDFPKLHKYKDLTYKGLKAPFSQKASDLKRFREMISFDDPGLKLNVWYHVMRDFPEELLTEYPEIADINSGFLWEYIDKTLTEFFALVPEVDRLTLISLHETPSVLKNTGNMSREETLHKLYMTVYGACKRAGKELIIRDFIDTIDDYKTFWAILDKIPQDVYVMTKSVSGDWSHIDMAVNPMMNKYKNRKLIVEYDLYGEWAGRIDFPVCCPEDIYRHIRECKALGAIGCTGRLIHDYRPIDEYPYPTIFGSPVEVNCYAFAKALSEPIPWLGETGEHWNEDFEAIDKKYWMMWAKKRYEEDACVPIVRALERTSDIAKLTFDIAGISFRLYVWYPTLFRVKPGDPSSSGDSWFAFTRQAEQVGIEYLKDEKQRALKLANESLKDIQSTKDVLNDKDYQDLIELFEGMILIIQSYDAALEGYNQVYLSKSQANDAGQKEAAKNLEKVAAKIDKERGVNWYFKVADEMRVLASEVLKGEVPIKK